MKKLFIMLAVAAIAVAAVGCGKKATPKITDNEWMLKTMELKGVPYVITADNPTITFTDSSTVNGYTGCNRYFGNYELDGTALNIQVQGSTKAMCANMYIEDALMQVFNVVTYYEIDNGQLVISGPDGKDYAIFAPVKNETK